jgi:hypothetical protein
MHSLAQDGGGNLWVTLGPVHGLANDPASLASLAFLDASTGAFVLLPPLSFYPYTSSGRECTGAGEPVGFNGAGVAFDARAGAIWFADFCRKRIGRFLPLPR